MALARISAGMPSRVIPRIRITGWLPYLGPITGRVFLVIPATFIRTVISTFRVTTIMVMDGEESPFASDSSRARVDIKPLDDSAQ